MGWIISQGTISPHPDIIPCLCHIILFWPSVGSTTCFCFGKCNSLTWILLEKQQSFACNPLPPCMMKNTSVKIMAASWIWHFHEPDNLTILEIVESKTLPIGSKQWNHKTRDRKVKFHLEPFMNHLQEEPPDLFSEAWHWLPENTKCTKCVLSYFKFPCTQFCKKEIDGNEIQKSCTPA